MDTPLSFITTLCEVKYTDSYVNYGYPCMDTNICITQKFSRGNLTDTDFKYLTENTLMDGSIFNNASVNAVAVTLLCLTQNCQKHKNFPCQNFTLYGIQLLVVYSHKTL